MPIEFNCPNCGRHYKVADANAGKRFACKDCGQPATVPGGAAPQVAPPPPAPGGYDDDYAEYDDQGYEQGYDEQGYGDQGYAAPQPRLPQPRMPGQRGPGGPGGRGPGGPGRPRLPGGRGPGGPRPPMGYGGGAPRPYGHGGRQMGPQKPHRAGMVFAFAMLGWFICGIFSIVSLVMSGSDLKEMRAGVMDRSGEGLTKASYYLSIVAVALMVLGLLMFVVILAMGGMASSGSSEYQQQRYQQQPRYSTPLPNWSESRTSVAP